MSEEPARETAAEGQNPPEAPVGAAIPETERLQAEVAALRDQVLREQAEMQNLRRRTERDVESARKFALERFAGDLLPVVDSLERALKAAGDASEAMKPVLEGIELTHRQLEETLRRFQVEPVDPKGQLFDPQYHEAVASVPAPGTAPNTVLEVMQKGYTLNGRVIRAAMVVVAQG